MFACCQNNTAGTTIEEETRVSAPETKAATGGQQREERPVHKFNNEATYTGQWLGNQRDGQGTQVWADGAKYDGQWLADKAHGKGKFIHENGDAYEGQWK